MCFILIHHDGIIIDYYFLVIFKKKKCLKFKDHICILILLLLNQCLNSGQYT